jgi:hypothetical protein
MGYEYWNEYQLSKTRMGDIEMWQKGGLPVAGRLHQLDLGFLTPEYFNG